MKQLAALIIICAWYLPAFAQGPDEDQLGAWYMYFFNKRFEQSPWGIQGDYQLRSWNFGSDLEQLLLRTGVTYSPKNAGVTFTLGYAHITTGAFGESTDTFTESRMYQEALLPQKVGGRFLLTHRFRYEQRWVEDQDFRTRCRYNLFVNIPINNVQLTAKTVYIALYNEVFINGQRAIGDGRSVQIFDRNRAYMGVGYGLRANLRMQCGWMLQTTNDWSKGQAQVSLHHNF